MNARTGCRENAAKNPQRLARALLGYVPANALIAELKARLLGGEDDSDEIVKGCEAILEADAALLCGRSP
jgi:hypothetical protein